MIETNETNVAAASPAVLLIFLLGFACLIVAHGIDLAHDPTQRLHASYIILGLIQWLTIGALIWRWRRSGYPNALRWALLIAALLCSQVSADLNLIETLHGSYEIARRASLFFETTNVALLILACATTFRRGTNRITVMIDGAMTVGLIAMFYLFIFSAITSPVPGSDEEVLYIIHTFDVLNAFLLACAVLRLLGSQEPSRRHFFFVLAVYILTRAVMASVRNRLLLSHASPYNELLLDPGTIVLGLMCLVALPAWLMRYQPPSAMVHVTQSLSPLFLGVGLLGVSMAIWKSHHVLGSLGVSIAVLAYGARNVVTQSYLLTTEKHLLTLQEELKGMVSTDSLTGISNRRGFEDVSEREWAVSRRIPHVFAVLVIDIDFFKQYNDHFGHVMGDQCLRTVARLLAGTLRRPSDFICRFGGEEFVAVLPATDLPGARIVARRMNAVVRDADLPHVAAASSRVTVSIGVAALDDSDESIQALLDRADANLYRAKAMGRNQYQ